MLFKVVSFTRFLKFGLLLKDLGSLDHKRTAFKAEDISDRLTKWLLEVRVIEGRLFASEVPPEDHTALSLARHRHRIRGDAGVSFRGALGIHLGRVGVAIVDLGHRRGIIVRVHHGPRGRAPEVLRPDSVCRPIGGPHWRWPHRQWPLRSIVVPRVLVHGDWPRQRPALVRRAALLVPDHNFGLEARSCERVLGLDV